MDKHLDPSLLFRGPHKRRVRYKGTHPRKFREKYKELDPENYSEGIDKVIARGQTPAGMHRPICVREILDILKPCPGEIFLDATLGYGGHAQEILPKLLPSGKLIGIDVDPCELPRTEARLRKAGFYQENFYVHKLNFAGISTLLPETNGGFDGILADLGVSSMQLDTPERGFSFKSDGPLDMRLNPMRGISAAAFIESHSEKELATIIAEYSDEPYAASIAQAIKNYLQKITRTRELAELVRQGIPAEVTDIGIIKKTVQRTFMALRIAVNSEFDVLDRFLECVPWCMKPNGRATILTFHPGEEQRVNAAFQKGLANGLYESIALTPIRPSYFEQASNPRSSCARLWWAVRSRA